MGVSVVPGVDRLSASQAEDQSRKDWTERSSIILPFQITVHYREENLEEEVDGIEQYRKEEEPRFSRHVEMSHFVSSLDMFLVISKDVGARNGPVSRNTRMSDITVRRFSYMLST